MRSHAPTSDILVEMQYFSVQTVERDTVRWRKREKTEEKGTESRWRRGERGETEKGVS